MDYLEEFWRSLKEGILEKCSLENFVQIFVIKKTFPLKFVFKVSQINFEWKFYDG